MRSEAGKLLVFGLLSMTSVVLANRTIAIYHDGLRTSAIELWVGRFLICLSATTPNKMPNADTNNPPISNVCPSVPST